MEPEFCPFCGRHGVDEISRVEHHGYIEIGYRCRSQHRWVLLRRK